MQLHHKKTGVLVDDQTRETVTFTVDEAAGIGTRQQWIVPAQGHGARYLALEKGSIDGCVLVSCQQTNDDGGTRVVVAATDEAAFAIYDIDDVTG
jgi:hypothetical protein